MSVSSKSLLAKNYRNNAIKQKHYEELDEIVDKK